MRLSYLFLAIVLLAVTACEDYVPPGTVVATDPNGNTVITVPPITTHSQAVAAALGEQIWDGGYTVMKINCEHATIVMHAHEGSYTHVAPWTLNIKHNFYAYFTVTADPGYQFTGFAGSVFTQQGPDVTAHMVADAQIDVILQQTVPQ